MGKLIDRLALRACLFVLGFCYFRLATPRVWLAALLALALCLMLGQILGKRWPLWRKGGEKRRWTSPFSRKRAPSCALYGVLYMGLYLWLGQLIYLPMSLILLFWAGMCMHQKENRDCTERGERSRVCDP